MISNKYTQCVYKFVFKIYISLTHWGRVTYICVSKLTSVGPDNGLSPCLWYTGAQTTHQNHLVGVNAKQTKNKTHNTQTKQNPYPLIKIWLFVYVDNYILRRVIWKYRGSVMVGYRVSKYSSSHLSISVAFIGIRHFHLEKACLFYYLLSF